MSKINRCELSPCISLRRARPLLFRWTSSSELNANLHFGIVRGRLEPLWSGMGWDGGVACGGGLSLSAASWHLAPNDVEGHCGKWRLCPEREGERGLAMSFRNHFFCPQTPSSGSSPLLCLTLHIVSDQGWFEIGMTCSIILLGQ